MLRCFNVCNEKFRKLEFLMLFVNLALENGRKMDFPMPIVKTTYFTQYQWEKCNTLLILDLSVDMPNVEMLALSQRPLVNIFSQISFTYAQGLSKRSTSVASLLLGLPRLKTLAFEIFRYKSSNISTLSTSTINLR